jgi:3-hydroxybutyryl-CoA dehydrogenase
MDVLDIKKIAVIGSGLMGHGIVQEFAQAGYDTYMFDKNIEGINKAIFDIQCNLENIKNKGLITEKDVQIALAKIHTSNNIHEIHRDIDIVIESVSENLQLKQDLFQQLEELCSEDTIFTSNTSSFPPSMLAEKMKRPERLLITHYFNPAYLVPLVEIVKGEKTEDQYVTIMYELYKKMGKSPVILKKEFPGFIANRLQIAMLREALYIVESGVADAIDVDTVIKNSIGRRWAVAGVFEIAELAGLDLFLTIASVLQPTLNASPEPLRLLKEKVSKGELGAKSGKGFYDWSPERVIEIRQKMAEHLLNMKK